MDEIAEISTKPYLIRAIYEWCVDSGFTPYLAVVVDGRARVPMEFVKDGEITLNISTNAARNLTIGNDLVQFSARFNGASREISAPIDTVLGIFSRENGQGMFFPKEEVQAMKSGEHGAGSLEGDDDAPPTPPKGKPRLQVVK